MEQVPENSVPEDVVIVPEELTKLSPPVDESSAFVQSTEDSQDESSAFVQSTEAVKEPPTPRKPGRPKGSKDARPRATKKTKVVSVAVEDESSTLAQSAVSVDKENIPELPRVLPNSRPIPISGHDNRSRLMLDMLARQAHERKTRKSDLWKSWFQ